MGKLYSLISALLLAVSAAFAAPPSGYEWWFDDDVSSVQSGRMSGSALDLQPDVSSLPKGIHYFNFRFSTDEGAYGTVYRKMFHSFGEDNGAISYEYWFDSDYVSKVSGNIEKGSNSLELDISSLPEGAHFFNFRLGYGDGNWGAVYRKMFLNLSGSINAEAYEYWLDNNYESKTEGSLSDGDNSYLVNLDGVRKGLHRFNYRVRTDEGTWGSVFSKYFYIASNEARFTEYEYWLDKDYANRKSATVTSNPVAFDVDLSGFDKSGGAHSFNLRVRNGDGEWGSVYSKLLVFKTNDGLVPIIGYRHYINGEDLGYVEVERTVTDMYMFEVDLADDMLIGGNGGNIVFDGDNVSIGGTGQLSYTLQIRTELGWAVPEQWNVDVDNAFSTTAVEMQVNSMRTFPTPEFGKFVAVKFTAAGTSLYFRADSPIEYDIYRNGELVSSLSATQMAEMTAVGLEAGEYFGVLHDAGDGAPDDFTFHIMDTPNIVPSPEISFDRGMVSITCSREDAEIRYTVDGSAPNVESLLYREPFTLSHNALVMAMAYVPGSDIEPSEIVDFEVDSYKVPKPVGVFDAASQLLSLSCEMDEATILYTFNPDGEWIIYESPIQMRSNRTVYARATFEGYNDSDVVEIAVTGLPVGIPAPVIGFSNGMVEITCSLDGAVIHYSLDGTVPSTESDDNIYTAPFALDRNAVIMAVACTPNLDLDPSEIATYNVDSYKTATPTGSFDVATRLLTLSCATADARIYYSSTSEGGWTEYSAPIEVRSNRTVYARATRDGYHDSETAAIAVTELPDGIPMPLISFTDGTVEITCEMNEAVIHYSVDGNAPSTDSDDNIYAGPFAMDRNGVIMAVACMPDLDIDPSDIAIYTVDSYKTATPMGSFDVATRLLTLSCATADARIYYSSTSEGGWTEYSAPIEVRSNRTVYACATHDGYHDSETAAIAITELPDGIPMPQISFTDGMVEITCEMDEAVIHYSVDGTAPSTESDDNIYTGPFAMERNGVIMAVACMPDLDLDPSEIATYTVDSYKTATPYGQFDAATRLLTIFCDTEGAVISYAYDPDGEWTVYRAPITIAGNVTVYARAIREGYHDSDMAVIEVSEFKCEPVAISYNGRYVTLSTGDPHATIMYSTDGSHPADGLTYISPFDVAGLCRIRVMAVKDGYMDSDISEYEVTGYADGEHAVTSAGGVLRSCFGWTGNGFTDNLRSLRVEGVLNDDDYAFLRSMGSMLHLDLGKVTDAWIPDRAFAGTGLISISMPESIAQYGSGVLDGTANLCAVIWNSTTESLGVRLTADIDNPNVLLYVHRGVGVEDLRGLNVIEDGHAESVTLHYGQPYYAPRDFHASRVNMTRDFNLPTEIGRCGGWEAIVLPFTPDAITHERAGIITPFAAWDGDADGAKPFWLYASSAGGWWEARTIEACVPYIISMPNSPDYAEEYNLAGRVTFSASDVTLGPDANEPISTAWGSYRLVGTFMPVEDADARALNVSSMDDGVMAGSMFVGYEEAVPFGAYVTGAGPRRAIPVFGDWNGLRIPVVENNGLTVDSPSHGTIRVHSTRDRRIDIITVDGMAVCTLNIRAGETVMVEDLLRNYYICGGIKVLVR